jgi:hypothetical protein
MMRVIFWSTLISANLGVLLLMFLDRCTCGVPEIGGLLTRFFTWGAIFGSLFGLITLPLALFWNKLTRRHSMRRPLSIPKWILASALVGGFFYGLLEHQWIVAERHESIARK